MKKRLLSLLLAVAMLLMVTGSIASASELEPVQLIWYFGGTWPQPDQDEVFAEVNRMFTEKLNVTIDFRPVTYGDFETKMNVVISSGEKFDLCFTSNWCNNYGLNVGKGAFLPLDDLLKEYAPRTYAQVPAAFWDATRVNGKIYAVVNEQISARIAAITLVDKELAESGFDPATIEKNNILSIEPYLAYAIPNNPGSYFNVDVDALGEYLQQDWPNGFATPGAIDLTTGATTVINQWRSPAMEKYVDDMQYFGEKGYTNADVRIASAADNGSDRSSHLELAHIGGAYKPGGAAFASAAWDESVQEFPSGTPILTTSGIIATMQAISVTSENPERAMMVLEELNSREAGDDYNEIYNTLCFGIEGKNWHRDEEGKRVTDSFHCNTEWMFASNFQAVVQSGQPDDVWEKTKELNATATVSPVCGFVFDAAPVLTEVSSCAAIVAEYRRLINVGAITDDEFKTMQDRLDQAGAATIMAEMQSQIDAWLAAK